MAPARLTLSRLVSSKENVTALDFQATLFRMFPATLETLPPALPLFLVAHGFAR